MEFMSSWIQGIIVAVVIATIIEMILPNGNSKKYIKVVIGVYIIFNIVSPIMNKFTGNELDFTSIIDIDKYEEKIDTYEIDMKNLEVNNNSTIKEVYILNLKKDMKTKIEDKGYIVNGIYIEIDEIKEYEVIRLNLSISKKENTKENKSISNTINEIEEVNIKVEINNNNSNNIEEISKIINISDNEIEEIKNYINSTYQIDKDIIHINE